MAQVFLLLVTMNVLHVDVQRGVALKRLQQVVTCQVFIHTYHSHFIPEWVAEVSQIFLRTGVRWVGTWVRFAKIS
jgi:hypothetical protein